MSAHHPRTTRSYKASGSILSQSLATLTRALSATRNVLRRSPSASDDDTALARNALPDITADRQYVIADRVHSHYFGSMKVCFYHYSRKQVIHAVARKGSCTKELEFTPTLAARLDLPFNMDSAIGYVREHGFKNGTIAGAKQAETAPVEAAQPKPPAQATPVPADEPTPTLQEPKSTRLHSSKQTAKNRPFTGRVMFLGESMRPGRDGKPPYSTYVIKLQSESGGMEKEFLGEHLAELAEAKGVKEGSLVRVQLLGRNKFEVVVAGRTEERSRNEYRLDVL